MTSVHDQDLGDLFDLDGRNAVVTGGAAGIGRAIAVGFAEFGADVTVLDVDSNGGAETVDIIRRSGGTGRFQHTDVTSADALADSVASLAHDLGRLDICVASAGGGIRKNIFDTSMEEWSRVVDLNLASTWRTAKAFGRLLCDQGGGKFISIASIHGHVGDPGQSAYGPAKAGIVELTRVLALEWASHNVQVNCISPSHIVTQRVAAIMADEAEYSRLIARSPVGRFGETWELVGPAVFLASRASSFVTGHSLVVDGGWTAT